MAKLRSISTVFWSDPFVEGLSPVDKLLFIYLITNERTNMLGVYESTIRKISFETGIDSETVEKGLKGFERVGKIKRVGNWLILVNFMKHQNFNTNMKKSAIDTYNNLPNELKVSGLEVSKSKPLEGFERLSNGFGMVRKREREEEREREKESEDEDEGKQSVNDIETNFIQQFDLDSIYKVEDLSENYLKDDRVIKAVVFNKENGFKDEEHLKEMLIFFRDELIQRGETVKLCRDFNSHFRSWHKNKVKLNGSRVKPFKVKNPNNEKIIKYTSNVNSTPLEMPESEFYAMEERNKAGGYIYKIVG